MIEVGKIYCLKTTGEKVFVLGVGEQDVKVRRALTGEHGIYAHKVESFTLGEIETIKEHMQAQIAEMIEKGECQKELMVAEKKLNEQLERELAEDPTDGEKVVEFPGKAKKVDTSLN